MNCFYTVHVQSRIPHQSDDASRFPGLVNTLSYIHGCGFRVHVTMAQGWDLCVGSDCPSILETRQILQAKITILAMLTLRQQFQNKNSS